MSSCDAFAPVYDEWAAHMTDDVPFYVELAREADGPVVELAVGNGRVAIPLARETGRRVVGVDSSPATLAQAVERAAAAGVEFDLREGDMRERELELEEPAALVYCPFRALLHLRGWRDKRQVFQRVAASLLWGGRFAWHAFVFDHEFAARHDGLASRHGELWEYTEYARGDSRIDATAFVGAPGAEPRTVSLWWCTRAEWEGLVEAPRLEVEALYGWFDRRPFDDSSEEFVWIARKPA